MKKTLSCLLIIGLVLSLHACGTDSIALDSVLEMSREELEERLLGLSQEEIYEMWGQPDSVLSGLWGDIYLLPEEDQMLVLYYDSDEFYGKNGHVIDFKITEHQTK